MNCCIILLIIVKYNMCIMINIIRMLIPKNYLDLKFKNRKNNTFNKSVSSRPQIDGIIKKIKPIEKDNITEVILNSKKLNDIKTEKNINKQKKEKIKIVEKEVEYNSLDDSKRMFLKVAGVAGLGLAASALFPKAADAYVTGSTPTSNVVGLRNSSNTRINPATEDTLASLLSGQGVEKLSTSLSSSGIVHTPASGKKIRVYASRFSLTADATSVSFRFTSGGTDYEKYVSPKTGGLYGANNHPNYIEGGVGEVLYCNISGSTTVQINIDYLEV